MSDESEQALIRAQRQCNSWHSRYLGAREVREAAEARAEKAEAELAHLRANTVAWGESYDQLKVEVALMRPAVEAAREYRRIMEAQVLAQGHVRARSDLFAALDALDGEAAAGIERARLDFNTKLATICAEVDPTGERVKFLDSDGER